MDIYIIADTFKYPYTIPIQIHISYLYRAITPFCAPVKFHGEMGDTVRGVCGCFVVEMMLMLGREHGKRLPRPDSRSGNHVA
jgi:hypothetical protein